MINNIETSTFPDSIFRFFIYEPSENQVTYFKSKEDALKASESIIDNYLEEEWDEQVEQVILGEITHITRMVDKEFPKGKLENGYDEEGSYFGHCDYVCNYKMFPIIN